MIQLFKEKKTCVDRSSIRGVTKAKDHYDAISRHHSRPVANTDFLHRKSESCFNLKSLTSLKLLDKKGPFNSINEFFVLINMLDKIHQISL